MRRSFVALAALLGAAAPASATTFEFSGFPSVSDGAGTMLDSTIRFGDNGLDWQASFAPNAQGRTPEAFWAVFTAGPRPRHAAEDGGLAILYGDQASKKVWVYEYDPDRSRSSWRTGNLIDSYDVDPATPLFSDPDAQGHVYFDLHLEPQAVADINAYRPDPWQGLGFDSNVGRFGVSSQFLSNGGNGVYTDANPDGKIDAFTFVGETSYGRHYRRATAQPMPEPHAIAAFTVGLAVVGWGVARARRPASPAGPSS